MWFLFLFVFKIEAILALCKSGKSVQNAIWVILDCSQIGKVRYSQSSLLKPFYIDQSRDVLTLTLLTSTNLSVPQIKDISSFYKEITRANFQPTFYFFFAT